MPARLARPAGVRCVARRPASVRCVARRPAGVPVRAVPPTHSQQNTPAAAGPDPALSAAAAVAAQLAALGVNDAPWPGHGVQTAYNFCRDSGSLELSKYFGHSASLYHEDHFVSLFQTRCSSLLPPNAAGAVTGGETVRDDGSVVVRVRAGDGKQFDFTMERCEIGRRKGAWVTASVLLVEER